MKKSAEPPRHLKAGARRMWRELQHDYMLDDAAGVALLRAACEAFARAEEARAKIAQNGAVVEDRFGQPKMSPWVLIERDARGAMVGALRALRLEGSK